MITVITGTNRPGSNTSKVAEVYSQFLNEQGIKVTPFSLTELPPDFIVSDFYGNRSESFNNVITRIIGPASKIVIILPEYNGSFPGILKTFIDAVPREIWKGKKAALVGVATGRGGNLRGMDHLVSVFHYLGVNIFPGLLPVSSFGQLVNEQNKLTDINTLKALKAHVDGFISF